MKLQHTHGPWEYSGDDQDVWSVWGPDGDMICGQIMGNLALESTAEADARLIAQAPAMLEALIDLCFTYIGRRSMYEYEHRLERQAAEIIIAATGKAPDAILRERVGRE